MLTYLRVLTPPPREEDEEPDERIELLPDDIVPAERIDEPELLERTAELVERIDELLLDERTAVLLVDRVAVLAERVGATVVLVVVLRVAGETLREGVVVALRVAVLTLLPRDTEADLVLVFALVPRVAVLMPRVAFDVRTLVLP